MEDYNKRIQELEKTTHRIGTQLLYSVIVYVITTLMLFFMFLNLLDFSNREQKRIEKLETILKVKGLWVN